MLSSLGVLVIREAQPVGVGRARRVASLMWSAVSVVASVASSAALASTDALYPGTAVTRMLEARRRASALTHADLSGDWASVVRPKLLWAAGLKQTAETAHAFADDNHCDATCMLGDVSHNINDGDAPVAGIARHNLLGPHIERASLPELGEGGSWSTCTNGCHTEPPRDVAHVQFRARIAFRLVWAPPHFSTFVLVDDDGVRLATGTPTANLPELPYRQRNFALVGDSKFATEALLAGKSSTSP